MPELDMAGRIDVHHHFLSQEYLDSIGIERAAMPGSSGYVEPWTAQQSLELMDAFGIAASVISVSAPGVGLDNAQKTADLARACNEAQAKIISAHPRRFGMFAILPLPDIDASLRELDYAYSALSADGVVVMSNYAGDYIGARKFWPVFAELNRHESVLVVHPTLPHHYRGFPGVSLSTLEFPFDSARAIVSVLYDGTSEKFPDVKIIWSHAGGAMPYLAGRIAVLSRRNKNFQLSGDKLVPAMRNFYYDLTQSFNAPTFEALRKLVPIDHLLFGSDCPFAREPQVQSTLDEFERLDLTPDERQCLNSTNALTLFPRFQA
ncbi:MAG TPA: amidohydrolase family protein [Xanthobacteraceae bacterium]|jgi:predicted TIM-barrel fold metal-dependent hydrolase